MFENKSCYSYFILKSILFELIEKEEKMSLPHRCLLVALSLTICLSLHAGYKRIGRFFVPDSPRWERLDKETDDAFDGLCISLSTNDGIDNIIVFDNGEIECDPGQVKKVVDKAVNGYKKALDSKETLALNIEGRPWKGVRKFDAGEGITYYFGCTFKDLEVFRLYILRQSKTPLPADLKQFLASIKVTNLYPKSASTRYISKGNSLVSRKQYKEALKQFDRGIRKDPDHWPAWYYKGLCQRRMKDYTGAEKSLRTALKHGESSPLYVELGRTLTSAKKTNEAFQAFKNAQKMNPDNDEVFLYRGNLHMRQKEYDKALSEFESCLTINPCSRAAGYNSAEINYAIKKDHVKAYKLLQQVLTYHPNHKTSQKRFSQVKKIVESSPKLTKQLNKKPILQEPKPANSAVTAAQELPDWIKNLPEIPEVKAVPITPGVDYTALTQAQYGGAVRAAKEACRQLLGPMPPTQEKLFNEKWEPMLDYPAAECIEYLQKLVPLVEKALGTRTALADNLLLYDRLWTEAGYAAHYNEKAGQELMQSVARQAAIVQSLKQTVQQLSDELAGLGDPPDPGKLKAQASSRHQRAMRALKRLLGKSAPLEGAYDRNSIATYEYYNGERKKPYYSQLPLGKRFFRDVFLPLTKEPSGPVLMYKFTKKEPSKGGLFNFDSEPEEFQCMYAEPDGNSWASYYYDEEEKETYATFFRPDESGLIIDDYTLRDDEFIDATRTTYSRRALDNSVKRYPDGMNRKKLTKMIQENKGELDDSLRMFTKGRKAFQTYVNQNGFLPEMPRPGGLHWVLKDMQVSKKFDSEILLSKDQFLEEKILNKDHRIKDTSLSAKWTKVSTHYEYKSNAGGHAGNYIPNPDEEEQSTGGQYVPVKKEEKKYTISLGWSPAPLAVPDGGYWPMRIRGSGPWTFSFNHPINKNGKPSVVNTGALYAGQDKFFLFDHAPAADEDINFLTGKHDDSSLMSINAEKQGGNHLRCILFRSDSIQETQKNYPISFLIFSEAGWLKVDCVYELKNLDEEEAEYLLRKTAEQNEDAARMIAAIKADAPKIAATQPVRGSADDKEAEEILAERTAFHKANIEFCKKEINRLQNDLSGVKSLLNSGKARKEDIERYNDIMFKITCQKSNVITENDRIKELKTGEAHFSRTPFDEMCRMQTVYKCEQEVRQLDAAARAHRKAELLASKLTGGQKRKAQELIAKNIAEGGATDPSKWTKLNGALQNIYQGEQLQEIAKIEEEIAWKQAQLDVAENVKTGAEVGVTLMSLGGGPVYVTALYQTGTGFAEGGILEGVKRGLTTWSDAADIAVSGYGGWKKGGWLGMVEGASWSILLNYGPEAALNRINMRGMKNAEFELNTKSVKNIEINTKQGPIDLSPTRAAQFKQELEYGEAMAEDFFRSHARLRTAEIRGNLSPEEITRLRMNVRQKAAAVAHSMPAKSYLKYKAEPIKGKAYSETMDDILDDATAAFNWEMRNRGYKDQELFHCRNASSKGAGMDSDLALKEQPDFLPVKGDDGQMYMKRNEWLTKDGKAVSIHEYQEEGSKVLQEAYKKVTGGYNAKQSFVDLTTSVGHESYPDLTWLQLPKAGKHSDAGQVTKKLDEFFGKINPKKVPDSLKITTTKAEIMFKQHPELRPLGSMMESCRGTAKDLETKFIPLLDNNIRKIESIPSAKRTASQIRQLEELNNTKNHLGECLTTFKDIGEGRIPPYEWERQFRMTTGGKDPVSVIKRLQKMTQDAAGF